LSVYDVQDCYKIYQQVSLKLDAIIEPTNRKNLFAGDPVSDADRR